MPASSARVPDLRRRSPQFELSQLSKSAAIDSTTSFWIESESVGFFDSGVLVLDCHAAVYWAKQSYTPVNVRGSVAGLELYVPEGYKFSRIPATRVRQFSTAVAALFEDGPSGPVLLADVGQHLKSWTAEGNFVE